MALQQDPPSLADIAGVPLLVGALVAAFMWHLVSGVAGISVADVFRVLAGQQEGVDPIAGTIVWQLRLPRAVLAVAVGGGLGVAGAAMQALFRNPLADPALIGVSSGSAVGAALVLVLMPAAVGGALPLAKTIALPLAAFVGGLAATLFVFALSRTADGRTSSASMLLTGIAVNALGFSLIGLANHFADDIKLRDLSLWLFGSLGGAGWDTTLPALLASTFCAALIIRHARALDALLLGTAEAADLGVDVASLERRAVFASALIVGAATAAAGIIGFVGLVVPHLVRLMFGPLHGRLLPCSVLLGALVMLVADVLARTLIPPEELPIGVLLAAVGAPFFLYLLRRARSAEVLT